MHRMTASCDSRNIAAQRLFAKVGMRREGEFRKDQFVSGAWANTVWHAILAEEYLNSKNEHNLPTDTPPNEIMGRFIIPQLARD